jgi:hypothetical protein
MAMEDAEVDFHALQATNEQFQLREWSTVVWENCIVVLK